MFSRLENLQRENKALRKDLSAAEKKLSELGSSLNDANEEVRKKSKTANGYCAASGQVELAAKRLLLSTRQCVLPICHVPMSWKVKTSLHLLQ